MINILVFGKDGQLGKAFQSLLDKLVVGQGDVFHVHYLGRKECDLADPSALQKTLAQLNPNLIINASAYTAVDRAQTEADLAFAINARAPEIMAQYAVAQGATLLHYSTDYVFDGEKYGFYLENDLRNPLGVYGKSKAAGEEAISKAFAQVSAADAKARFAIFRTSWVYGDGANFIRTILRLAKERDALKVINDQYGVPTSADWLAHMSLDFALNQDLELRRFPSGIYHAVPLGETTWHGLATLAIQVAHDAGISLKASPNSIGPIPTVEYPLPAPRPMNSRMSTDKLRLLFEGLGDVSKLQQFNQPWDIAVKAYVTKLAQAGLI
jgi:dTDP-4-dehydrorhamnose reductase